MLQASLANSTTTTYLSAYFNFYLNIVTWWYSEAILNIVPCDPKSEVKMSEVPTGPSSTVPVEEFVSADKSVESTLEVLSAQPTNACGFSVSNWKKNW